MKTKILENLKKEIIVYANDLYNGIYPHYNVTDLRKKYYVKLKRIVGEKRAMELVDNMIEKTIFKIQNFRNVH